MDTQVLQKGGCMQWVSGEHSLDDLFGVDFTGAGVIERFSNDFERRGTVTYVEFVPGAFVVYVMFESGSAGRIELLQAGGDDSWFVQVPDSDRIIVERVRYAIDSCAGVCTRPSHSEPVCYEFFW